VNRGQSCQQQWGYCQP